MKQVHALAVSAVLLSAGGPQRHVPLHCSPGLLWSPADDTTGGANAREIRRLREASNAAIARHDTAGLSAILAPDVIVLASTSSRTVGRDANARAFAEQFHSRPDVIYRRTPVEVRVFEPWMMASESGEWTGSWSEPDGRVSLGGSYFAKWRRIGGRWLVEGETYVPERCSGSRYCDTMKP